MFQSSLCVISLHLLMAVLPRATDYFCNAPDLSCGYSLLLASLPPIEVQNRYVSQSSVPNRARACIECFCVFTAVVILASGNSITTLSKMSGGAMSLATFMMQDSKGTQ